MYESGLLHMAVLQVEVTGVSQVKKVVYCIDILRKVTISNYFYIAGGERVTIIIPCEK